MGEKNIPKISKPEKIIMIFTVGSISILLFVLAIVCFSYFPQIEMMLFGSLVLFFGIILLLMLKTSIKIERLKEEIERLEKE